jgi:hypothetical protein
LTVSTTLQRKYGGFSSKFLVLAPISSTQAPLSRLLNR